MTVSYSADGALNNEEEDLFGRAGYAKRIASVIAGSSIEDSYVLGLYSPWGYGKTSTLNLIEKNIGKKASIIRFNPWSFENESAIIRGLLTEISLKIEENTKSDTKQVNENGTKGKVDGTKSKLTRGNLLSAKEAIGELIEKYSGAGAIIDKRLESGAQVAAKLLGTVSNVELKKRIENKIRETNKRIIIMVDDVDRLDKDEVFKLFKLIKVVADFKGITYILAFDDKAVSEALSDRFAGSDESRDNTGQEFIEKIVQIPLHLPLIEPEALEQMLFTGIDKTLETHSIEIDQDDVDRFRSIFDEHISPHIKTPRMIKRYLNVLNFVMPMVAKEVNPTDLLLLESIRLIYPRIYLQLRHNKQLLTGTLFHLWVSSDKDQEKERELIDKIVGDKENIREVLKALFPHVDKAYGGFSSGISSDSLGQSKRVASGDYFNRYFMYDISPSDVSDTSILEILGFDNADDIEKNLRQILTHTKHSTVMRKLKAYSNNAVSPIALARGLMGVFDTLSKEKSSFFGDSAMDTAVELMIEVAKKEPNKLEAFVRLIDECENLDQLMLIIREVVLGSKENKQEPLLAPAELEEFEKAVVTKIRLASKKGVLHRGAFSISHILYSYWAEYGSREETNAFLKKNIKNTDQALGFVSNYLGVWRGGRGSHRGDFNRETHNYICKVIDMDHIYNILVKENPDLQNIEKYPELEDARGDVGREGNENSEEFKKILSEQIVVLMKNMRESEANESTTDADSSTEVAS